MSGAAFSDPASAAAEARYILALPPAAAEHRLALPPAEPVLTVESADPDGADATWFERLRRRRTESGVPAAVALGAIPSQTATKDRIAEALSPLVPSVEEARRTTGARLLLSKEIVPAPRKRRRFALRPAI